MAATVTIKSRFTWNPKVQRYQLASGRFVKATAVKRATMQVIRQSQAEMRSLTQQLNRGELTIENWRARFASELKNVHVSNAMAGAGGMGNMTQSDYGRVGQELRFQYQRLNGFAAKLKAGELSEAQAEARAEMYVASGNKTFEAARRAKASEVFTEERNVLGATDKHCEGCLAETARGWVPIGMLMPPGERNCMALCKCRYAFRKSPNR